MPSPLPLRPLLGVFLTLLHFTAQGQVPPPLDHAPWEKEVAQIEAQHQTSPPAPGGIVFAGSSSIRLWDLPHSFPGLTLSNCGFGGSLIEDSTFFAPRLILPLRPRLIVFYAGDNDAAAHHAPSRIAQDFTAFASAIHQHLPTCRILYLPIKPSPARQLLLPEQRQANALIAAYCASQPSTLRYLDVASPLLGPSDTLRPELYQKDGLHLSPAGYAIWNHLLRPLLEKAD